ncbi:MAG: DUF2887 domain-containing protein, partial [Proteobacteria bacterium]|nr:DUF2887 domain-containing protein [Pseudomonadota bacterium]
DKELYKIFSAMPELLFELTEIPFEGKYSFKSVTIKEFSRTMDGLMEPEDPEKPRLVVEFQMQKKENPYYRAVLEMAALGQENPGIDYYGVIVFGDRSLDPKTTPWARMVTAKPPFFWVFYLEELLKELAEKNPEHPLLAVFQPFIQKDDQQLKKDVPKHYARIEKSDYSEEIKGKLIDIFIHWLSIRFDHISRNEVQMLLKLTTPLEETQCYKDIVATSEIRGEKRGE